MRKGRTPVRPSLFSVSQSVYGRSTAAPQLARPSNSNSLRFCLCLCRGGLQSALDATPIPIASAPPNSVRRRSPTRFTTRLKNPGNHFAHPREIQFERQARPRTTAPQQRSSLLKTARPFCNVPQRSRKGEVVSSRPQPPICSGSSFYRYFFASLLPLRKPVTLH
jgi:hypothetical protein